MILQKKLVSVKAAAVVSGVVEIFVVPVVYHSLPPQVHGLQTGWKLLWKVNLVPSQNHQMHGSQKLF